MSVTDPYSVPNINEVIRDKIIACGAVPLVTDMFAVNAYPVLFRQLLDLLCCGACGGGGLYYHAAITPGDTVAIVAASWGPTPTGVGGFGAGAFPDAIPVLPSGVGNNQFLLQVPTPPGPTAAFSVPAAALAGGGGWIDSVVFTHVGNNQYVLTVDTNGVGVAQNTTFPFIITAPISMVGYVALIPEVVEPEA